jgi:type I restriction enzyme M protein
MLGAIIGDVAGSRYEFVNCKSRDFKIMDFYCEATDDSIMTMAIAEALQKDGDLKQNAIEEMRKWGAAYPYPMGGYGVSFRDWLYSPDPKPYGSYGNGAAMRVSPCGEWARSEEEAKKLAYSVTCVTHDHPEGLKGAEVVALCVFWAKQKLSKDEISRKVSEYYALDFTCDYLNKYYGFDDTCQGTVPQAITCFLESSDFESAIRNVMYIGGDSDTIGTIVGGIAEAYYGIPDKFKQEVLTVLDRKQRDAIDRFYAALRKRAL